MQDIFSKNPGRVPSQVDKMVNFLRAQDVSATPANAKSVLSLESLTDSERHSLTTVGNSLSTAIEALASDLGIAKQLTAAQVRAGTIAGVLAGDFRSVLARSTDFNAISTESMGVVQMPGLADAIGNRAFALEAYDERDNRNAVVYSIAYNMQSSRQDEFGETFFPTLVITPDNTGYGVTVNLLMVFDGVTRKITGNFEDFKKKNIIRAVADASVLRKEQTRIVPVARAQALDKFVAASIVAPAAILLEGESITTAPLAVGKKLDLLALSQTDALLAAGAQDNTDSIDPSVSLKAVYAKIGADVLRFDTLNLPLSNFVYATQNNYRVENLAFATTSVLLNKNTKHVDGTALADLAGVVTSDLIVRLELNATGSINIETGETNVFGNSISVYSVQDNAGNLLDLTTAPAKAIVDAVAAGSIVGYDLLAYRTNMNRRQRGQLIDVTKYTQLYNVPLRSPITALHPISTDGQTDASDVQALITATRIRTSNEAVTALLGTASQLRQYVDSRDAVGVGPDILGVGRFFVRPTYFEDTIDMKLAIDSVKSHERAADIQAVLVNKIRDMAFRMYRDSEYKAAADALAGGISQTPTVIVGTDPVLARYLTVTGDLRTIGGEFDIRIVSSLDSRVEGKIFISFGVFNEERNVAPNPLGFGNMVWAPELVLSANISRNGGISKETVVQPRYLFVTNTPILSVISVENVPDVLNKVAINMHQI